MSDSLASEGSCWGLATLDAASAPALHTLAQQLEQFAVMRKAQARIMLEREAARLLLCLSFHTLQMQWAEQENNSNAARPVRDCLGASRHVSSADHAQLQKSQYLKVNMVVERWGAK